MGSGLRTLLKNGNLVDGTGAAGRVADLLVEDDRIVKIGIALSDEADEVIDCSGLVVAPGFIDVHSHNDCFAYKKDNEAYFVPFLEQGITTQVSGNCGFSPFGYEEGTKHRALLGSGLFDLKDLQGDASSLPAFASLIPNLPLNLVPLIGHMSPRIGIGGYENRALSEDELRRSEAVLEQALVDGAAGVSFGLMYEPDRYAPYEELRRAAAICAKHGKILSIHGRANSAASTSYDPPIGGRAHNLRAIDEMKRLARETGVRIQHSHLLFVGERSWKTVDEALGIIDRLNQDGLDFKYDSFSLTYGVSVITVVLPSWFLSMDAKQRRGPLARLRLAFEIGLTKRVLGFDFCDIVIAWIGEGHEDLAGKRVTEIAAEWGTSALDAYIRLVELSGGKGRVLMHRYLTEDIVLRLMKDEHCYFMTDAWIETKGKQNPACYLCFPLFFKLARENGIPLESVVHRMTGMAADRFGIEDRGILKEGYFADLTAFHADTIGPGSSDEGRPLGISLVMVNGSVVVRDGAYGGLKDAGRMLLQQET